MSYKDIKSFEQECKEKNAEIERLKESAKYDSFLREKYRALITELCDALEGYCWDESGLNHDPEAADLIQRAREATR